MLSGPYSSSSPILQRWAGFVVIPLIHNSSSPGVVSSYTIGDLREKRSSHFFCDSGETFRDFFNRIRPCSLCFALYALIFLNLIRSCEFTLFSFFFFFIYLWPCLFGEKTEGKCWKASYITVSTSCINDMIFVHNVRASVQRKWTSNYIFSRLFSYINSSPLPTGRINGFFRFRNSYCTFPLGLACY